MKYLLLILAVFILLSMTGCEKKCPKPIYPKLEGIDRVPKVNVKVKGGILDHNGTKNVFKTIKALRVSEHYYFTLIGDYTKEFIK